MAQHRRPSGKSTEKTDKEKTSAGQKANKSGENGCRCKEVSKKTLPEMIKLMIKDLTSWKK